MGISVERNGFVTCKQLSAAIVTDLLANGFIQKFPTTVYSSATDDKVTLEAGPTVDPLNIGDNPQAWRIQFDAKTDFRLDLFVGHKLQLGDDGTVAQLAKTSGSSPAELSGMIGTSIASESGVVDAYPQNHFVDRTNRLNALSQSSYPMSYRLTVSDRGFALFVWEEGSDADGNKFSWIIAQRAVDSKTGATYVTGKSPVWCLYSLNNFVWKRVIREADVLKPSLAVTALANTEDSRMVINGEAAVAIDEDNKYIVMFPNGLNTARYAYSHELDLIGYTSADVVSQRSEVPLTVYGETTPRIYKAMSANGPNNTKMRLLILIDGKGVTS